MDVIVSLLFCQSETECTCKPTRNANMETARDNRICLCGTLNVTLNFFHLRLYFSMILLAFYLDVPIDF